MTQAKEGIKPEDKAPEGTEQEETATELAMLEPSKEDKAVAKLKKGEYTPTGAVVCKNNTIKGRGEVITPDDVRGGKSTFDNLVAKKRIFKA